MKKNWIKENFSQNISKICAAAVEKRVTGFDSFAKILSKRYGVERENRNMKHADEEGFMLEGLRKPCWLMFALRGVFDVSNSILDEDIFAACVTRTVHLKL